MVIGAGFCFRGYLAMRVIIPFWGAFAGFMLGAGLVDAIDDSGFLATLLGWLVGWSPRRGVRPLSPISYYEVAIVIGMSASDSPSHRDQVAAWCHLVVGDHPGRSGCRRPGSRRIAYRGRSLRWRSSACSQPPVAPAVIVAGLMLILGVVDLEEFDSAATTQLSRRRLVGWYATTSCRWLRAWSHRCAARWPCATLSRDSWAASGGKHLRTEAPTLGESRFAHIG